MTVHQIKTTLKICCLGVVVFLFIWGVSAYRLYAEPVDYHQYLEQGTMEEAHDFAPLTSDQTGPNGMVLAAENNELRLYVHTGTTEIVLEDLGSGNLFYSNPENRLDDLLANGVNKDLLSSQLSIEYFNEERLKKEMNNYTDAIQHEQFVIQSIDDGIRITYTIGDLSKGVESLPMFLTPERLQTQVLDHLDERSARTVSKYYVESVKKTGFLEMRNQVAEARIVLNKMLKAFEEAGYTEEDLKVDNELADYVSDIQKIYFVIPVDYKLDGNELIAKINTDDIITEGPGKLSVIQLLANFGAGAMDDEGYMMVPSGSGALIDFNNGKAHHDYYYEKVYGFDPSGASMYATQYQETVRMPVYGIKSNDQAYLARIVDGEAIAAIKADVSGRVNSYNTVGPIFTIRDNELVSLFGASGINADLPLVEERAYKGDLSVAFSFLVGDEANYSGMAKVYRNHLLNEGELAQVMDQELPFYVDVIGAIEKKAFALGVPYRKTEVMTHPDEAVMMVKTLSGHGAHNMKVRYQGWFNDGYYHDVARDIDVESKLGGEKAIQELDQTLEDMGSSLFPDVAFAEVSSLSDRYSETFESARYIAGVNVFKAPYHPSLMRMYTFYDDDFMRIVSPAALPRHVEGFERDYDQLGISRLSLRDLGDVIASDKKMQASIDREWSKDISAAMVKTLADEKAELMVEGGNAYVWPYATDIVGVPLSSNHYYIIDRDIPFMQMVLHGSVNYATPPLNLISVSDQEELILKLIETGTAPRYTLTDSASSEVVKTAYQMFYSTDYGLWVSEATDTYQQVSMALNQVHPYQILSHDYISDVLIRVTYEGDRLIYINYGDEAVVIDEISVPAKSWKMKGGR